jgi:putative heme-binding domain-containing protein
MVAPGAVLAEGFETRRVRRRDGRELIGRVVSDSAEAVVLEVAGGERVELPLSVIEEQTTEPSGMPPIGRLLAPRRLRDVLAYVMTLEPGVAEAPPGGAGR